MATNEKNQAKSEANVVPEQQATLNDNMEDSNAGVDEDCQPHSIYSEASRIAWKWICWSGAKTFDGLDFAGEVLANFLGLNQSKYQWIADAQQREKDEKLQRRLEKRQRRQLRLEQLLEAEQRKLQELEIGALGEETAFVDTSAAA
ncbi:hypothetical protein PHMEG_000195 [Phytophthora megakarya]|uniref:Uncharacterized protein n=1 Tax=Phytophthora megakarya TaxID=4795 RepID=A0A225X4J7_9STRA|nr:hypothetical protein PHMEG_000195 [Phytophthora megakarya]